jgi:uncharacterized surface protein with fasciclin (FAS1) repeats
MNSNTRREVLKGIGSAGVLLAGGIGTASARGRPEQAGSQGRREGASAENTITGIADASDDFNTLVNALEATDLAAVLDSNDDQFTVFAPTDEEFGDLLEALDVSAEELLARDDLANILRYHVTEGRRYAASVVNPAPVEMLNGETVTTSDVSLNGGTVYTVFASGYLTPGDEPTDESFELTVAQDANY